jgi:hypothetical protein
LCRPHLFTHPVKMEEDFGTITEVEEEVEEVEEEMEEPTEIIQSLSSSSYFDSCFNF